MRALLQVPPIPPGIKGEGTLAVLFMVLLGVLAVLYLARQLPQILPAWKAFRDSSDSERLLVSISRLIESNAELVRSIDRLTTALGRTKERAQRSTDRPPKGP